MGFSVSRRTLSELPAPSSPLSTAALPFFNMKKPKDTPKISIKLIPKTRPTKRKRQMAPKPIVSKENFGDDSVGEPICPTCGSDDVSQHFHFANGEFTNVWFECEDCGQQSDTGRSQHSEN